MTYFYLATPYTKYPKGTEQAFKDAAHQASLLVAAGIKVFCPITHSHPLVPYIPMCKDNHDTWLGLDKAFMDSAIGIIVCKLEGWDQSYGVSFEINYMRALNRPLVWMIPDEVPEVLRPMSDIERIQRARSENAEWANNLSRLGVTRGHTFNG